MISGLKKFIQSHPAFAIALGFFLALELLLYMIPVELGEGAGVFLTNYRRSLAESSTPDFDYIVFGDSRSLSLMGHAPSTEENWSVYNFSLPAMGPRYFPFLFKKYMAHRTKKPAAVIFSADPELFQKSFTLPLHDPRGLYSPDVDQTLLDYLKARVVKRIQYLFDPPAEPEEGPYSQDMIWNAFSHRYLQLFSPLELMEQYTGPERVFILKESIPLLYRTYRFRKAIKSHTFGIGAQMTKVKPLPDVCNSCDGLLRPECHPDLPRVADNIRLRDGLNQRYGQINLADRLDLKERFLYHSVRDKMINDKVKYLNKTEPDLRYLEQFVDTVTKEGIRVVITDVPSIDAYGDTLYHRHFFQKVRELAQKNPLLSLIRFPEPYYPRELFVEQVHYDCPGARRLNREFYASVMPEILKFAPPDPDANRVRGFGPDGER